MELKLKKAGRMVEFVVYVKTFKEYTTFKGFVAAFGKVYVEFTKPVGPSVMSSTVNDCIFYETEDSLSIDVGY